MWFAYIIFAIEKAARESLKVMVSVKRSIVHVTVMVMLALSSFIFGIGATDAFAIDNENTLLSEYMTADAESHQDEQLTSSTPLVSTNGTRSTDGFAINGFIIAAAGLLTVGISTEAFLLYMRLRPKRNIDS